MLNTMINFDLLNFIIAVLALLVAVYSVFYTHRQNRCHITISNCERYSEDEMHIIHWFEINNIGSSPVTISSVNFLDAHNDLIIPIDYEPEPGSLTYIPDYMYANHLESDYVIQPYQDIQLGYYLPASYDCLTILVKCDERIHHFKKHQSFSVHFSDVQE